MFLKRIFAAFAALWLCAGAAYADQSALSAPTTGTLPGLTMVNDYNSALNALNTCNSGASAPANQLSATPSPGNCWYNTSTGAVSYYDGSYWLPVGYIDTTNHIWTPVLGGNAAVTLSSATTTNLCGGTAFGSYLSISGTVSISSFGTNCYTGQLKILAFTGAATLTYNATSMILPTGASITAAAGDTAIAVYLGSGNWKVIGYFPATGAALVQASYVAPPSGRLTLVSATPYMFVAEDAKATIYYTPTQYGNQIPVWNGSIFVPTSFVEINQSMSDTTHSPAAAVTGSVYDEFVCSYSGSLVLARGPAWSSLTARSLTISRGASGVWTNATAVQNAASTTICAAGYGVWVGTVMTDTSTATVTWDPLPAAASGGPTTGGGNPGAWVGLWNVYNQKLVVAQAFDNKASWASVNGTTTLDSSTNNRVTGVFGQPDSMVKTDYGLSSNSYGTSQVGIGVGVNTVSSFSSPIALYTGTNTSGVNLILTMSGSYGFVPVNGLNYVQAMQFGNTTSAPLYGTDIGQNQYLNAAWMY